MMERFFVKRSSDLYEGRPVEDIYPQFHFEVGATPEFTEKARTHEKLLNSFTEGNKSHTPMPPPYDAKWRYFWNVDNPVDEF